MPTADDINLYGPPVLIVLALLWGFARILFLNRRDGVSVLAVVGRRRSPVERGAALMAIIFDGYLLARPAWPDLDMLVMGQHFSNWGVALMALGIALAVLSQIDMGRSWRIGLPAEEGDIKDLVTGGLYQFSRNPIYVGIMLFLLGGVLLVPGPLTVGCTIVTWFFITGIIRDEEAFLTRQFGDAYTAYQKRVRRWL